MKKIRTLLFLLLLATIVLAAVFLPIEQVLIVTQQWAEANRTWAFSIVTAGITIGILLILPASLMTMLAGFLFGLVQGFASVWLAGLFASTLAFWISRTAARPWVERRIQRSTTFMAIDRAIQRKGFLVVLLTRLVMVLPYPPMNYSLGLTNVSFRDYLLGTNIGMAPPMFLFVYLGTTVSNVAAIMRGEITLEGNELIVGIAALVAVVLIVAYIIKTATVALREELTAASAEPLESSQADP